MKEPEKTTPEIYNQQAKRKDPRSRENRSTTHWEELDNDIGTKTTSKELNNILHGRGCMSVCMINYHYCK